MGNNPVPDEWDVERDEEVNARRQLLWTADAATCRALVNPLPKTLMHAHQQC